MFHECRNWHTYMFHESYWLFTGQRVWFIMPMFCFFVIKVITDSPIYLCLIYDLFLKCIVCMMILCVNITQIQHKQILLNLVSCIKVEDEYCVKQRLMYICIFCYGMFMVVLEAIVYISFIYVTR